MNSRGQGLVEYLVLVCLMGVATIAIVSVVGTNIREQYANISRSLRGERGPVSLTAPEESSYQKRGMDDFMQSSSGGR